MNNETLLNNQKILRAAALIDRQLAKVTGDTEGEALSDARVKETEKTIAAMRKDAKKGAKNE